MLIECLIYKSIYVFLVFHMSLLSKTITFRDMFRSNIKYLIKIRILIHYLTCNKLSRLTLLLMRVSTYYYLQNNNMLHIKNIFTPK